MDGWMGGWTDQLGEVQELLLGTVASLCDLSSRRAGRARGGF